MIENAERERVFITHSGCSRETVEMVREKLQKMNIFDEIIFLSDFIEHTRTHESCIKTREFVFSSLRDDPSYNIRVVERACLMELNNTIEHLKIKNQNICHQTLLARQSIKEKIS